jgi:hypothetical protein
MDSDTVEWAREMLAKGHSYGVVKKALMMGRHAEDEAEAVLARAAERPARHDWFTIATIIALMMAIAGFTLLVLIGLLFYLAYVK